MPARLWPGLLERTGPAGVLRQSRAGYAHRPRRFPQSVILCGVRDVRDYRIHSSAEKTIVTGGSAFNIKAESLRIGDSWREKLFRHERTDGGAPITVWGM